MEGLVNSEFWRGRKVFVTGHTGFKGGWLVTWLNKLGAQVTGFALPPPTDPSFFEVVGVEKFVPTVFGDIRDLSAVAAALHEAKPEIVLHLAAQALVKLSYKDPVGTYATNVMGSVHLLDAVRTCPSVRAVVMVTSDKCYENREWVWGYREDEAMGGYDPYSNSKGCSELIASAYRSSFFNRECYKDHRVAVASARAGNVIGGGDWAKDRLVPDFVRAMIASTQLKVRSPHAIRPWQHVLEPLSGYLVLAQKLVLEGPVFADGWNFGPDDRDAKPVSWLADRLVELWGGRASWCLDGTAYPHEAHYLKLDISKARMGLSWRPQWSLERALENVVTWHQSHLSGKDMREVSLEQIAAHQNSGV